MKDTVGVTVPMERVAHGDPVKDTVGVGEEEAH